MTAWLMLLPVGGGLWWLLGFPPGWGWIVAPMHAAMLGLLWIMGCLYNIPPFRTKDRPWLDVLSEAVNNPLRLLIGWYMVPTGLIAPLSPASRVSPVAGTPSHRRIRPPW